jgi:hypothetical protein
LWNIYCLFHCITIKIKTMKNVMKILGVVCLTFLAFSCSKDDDPADNDVFVGTYDGAIGYTNDGDVISSNDGEVTVVKTGDNYYFRFSDGIPNLTGVEFEESDDNVLLNVDFEDGVRYIRITESSLNILYTKNGATWTANCSR